MRGIGSYRASDRRAGAERRHSMSVLSPGFHQLHLGLIVTSKPW